MNGGRQLHVLIWGTGKLCQWLLSRLCNCEVLAFIETQKGKESYKGKRIIEPAEIDLYDFDRIIIASGYSEEILKTMIRLGIDLNKVIFLQVPAFNPVLQKMNWKNCIAEILSSGNAEELLNRDIWALKEEFLQNIECPNIVPRFLLKYQKSKDKEIQKIVEYVTLKNRVQVFNYEFTDKYVEDYQNPSIEYDSEADMGYILHEGKRMYFPKGWSHETISRYFRNIMMEQDSESPHCYFKEGYEIRCGDIVLEAGAAEGYFSLSVIDLVSKLFIVECDDGWMEALRYTFAPYKEKVVFIKKYLGAYNDDEHVTLDSIIGDGRLDFIKMDIEGAELSALQGGKKVFWNNSLSCALCCYHKSTDENSLAWLLNEYGYETEFSNGYMFFKYDLNSILDLDLRRGVIFANKPNREEYVKL